MGGQVMGGQIFHAGERWMQQRAGESAIADRHAGMLAGAIAAAAAPFIARQSMAALGSIDAAGQAWASLVFGTPGFMHTLDGQSLRIEVPDNARDVSDPLWANLRHDPALGMLCIEFASRRRYRINGSVEHLDQHGMRLAVREAFGNCPKYIQRRALRDAGAAPLPSSPLPLPLPILAAQGNGLAGAAFDIIERADTLFVASCHARAGADVSHRGGRPGFVRRVGEHTLRIPDYPGNSLFNTLGNLVADPHAGLCIPDFSGGRVLQLTGSAVIVPDGGAAAGETGGTGRYWDVTVARWILRGAPQLLEWDYIDASPFNPGA